MKKKEDASLIIDQLRMLLAEKEREVLSLQQRREGASPADEGPPPKKEGPPPTEEGRKPKISETDKASRERIEALEADLAEKEDENRELRERLAEVEVQTPEEEEEEEEEEEAEELREKLRELEDASKKNVEELNAEIDGKESEIARLEKALAKAEKAPSREREALDEIERLREENERLLSDRRRDTGQGRDDLLREKEVEIASMEEEFAHYQRETESKIARAELSKRRAQSERDRIERKSRLLYTALGVLIVLCLALGGLLVLRRPGGPDEERGAAAVEGTLPPLASRDIAPPTGRESEPFLVEEAEGIVGEPAYRGDDLPVFEESAEVRAPAVVEEVRVPPEKEKEAPPPKKEAKRREKVPKFMEPSGLRTTARRAGGAPAPTAARGDGWVPYRVRKGDTLYKILRREVGNTRAYQEVLKRNGITKPDRIKAGDVISIPQR